MLFSKTLDHDIYLQRYAHDFILEESCFLNDSLNGAKRYRLSERRRWARGSLSSSVLRVPPSAASPSGSGGPPPGPDGRLPAPSVGAGRASRPAQRASFDKRSEVQPGGFPKFLSLRLGIQELH